MRLVLRCLLNQSLASAAGRDRWFRMGQRVGFLHHFKARVCMYVGSLGWMSNVQLQHRWKASRYGIEIEVPPRRWASTRTQFQADVIQCCTSHSRDKGWKARSETIYHWINAENIVSLCFCWWWGREGAMSLKAFHFQKSYKSLFHPYILSWV